MFETHDQARLPKPFFIDESSHRWAYVAQTSNDLWFYVTHESLQDGDPEARNHQQYLIPALPYLLGLITTNTENAYVREIQLVTPPWFNKSKKWQMELLLRIRKSDGNYYYELENGNFYPARASNEDNHGEILWEKPKFERV